MGSDTTRLALEGISLISGIDVLQPGFHVFENAWNNTLAPTAEVTVAKPRIEIGPLDRQGARLEPISPQQLQRSGNVFEQPDRNFNFAVRMRLL